MSSVSNLFSATETLGNISVRSNSELTSSTADKPLLEITNLKDDATSGIIKLNNQKGGNNGDNADETGTIQFYGQDSAGNSQQFGQIQTTASNASNGSEEGTMTLGVTNGGAAATTPIITIAGSTSAAASTTTVAGTLSAGQISSQFTATTGTIAVTAAVSYDVTISQPAGTILKDLIVLNDGEIVTGGASGDDLNISAGTSAPGGTELLGVTALLDDGSSAVTWAAKTPLYIFYNSHGGAANQFADAGIGPSGGPATTVAIVAAGSFYSASARTIHVRFTPIQNDLATANTTIKVTATFQTA